MLKSCNHRLFSRVLRKFYRPLLTTILRVFLLVILFTVVEITDTAAQSDSEEPVKVVVAGLSHGHVHWVFGRDDKEAIEIAGVYEPDEELQQKFAKAYDLDQDLFYTDLDTALNVVDPEAVTAFGPVYDHLKVVEASAPRGMHVMVEKPLAVSLDHAMRMKELAEQHEIHLLTNYETTWYASNHAVYDKIHSEEFGDIRKMVAHDGHQGPKEIGVSSEFFNWLTDPRLNGGGALMDFGCYGANLMTWMMNGQEPLTVQAVTQQIKPEIYPEVDDEATIIVTYPKAQGIIQASWNWPYSRKDLQVYGEQGSVSADDNEQIHFKKGENESEKEILDPRSAPYDNPFTYFASVVRGETTVQDTDLSSLTNNITVMKILDAAKKSAKTGRKIDLRNE